MAEHDRGEEDGVEDGSGEGGEPGELEPEGVQVRASISEQQVLRLRVSR
jgi:hypothetical protein